MLHRKIAVMERFNAFWGYLSLCILCGQLTLTSTRTSTLWKLNPDEGKITSLKDEGEDTFMLTPTASEKFKDDEVFNIITSTVVAYGSYGHSWSKQSVEKNCDPSCVDDLKDLQGTSAPQGKAAKKSNQHSDEILDCGKPVNFTFYDYLIGVSQRFNHPPVPEPEVAYLFLKNKDEQAFKKFDVNALERRLKRAKREKPKSVHLYNQIGNYWRIKGDARQSIECFRRALAISPTNSEVLLNLARVLFNLQYLDDAIHLTRRSLEVQPPDRSAWRQYFTLGEIFKAYGHFQESLLHLRHALELYPQHEPILRVLRDVENAPASPLHVYTIFIIFALIIAVFIVVVTSSDGSDSNSSQSEFEPKIQRHFNRAMAMRSLKGFSSRTFKHRRY